jgi:hypothetical protein
MLRKANNVFSVIVDDNAQGALGLAAGTLLTDVNLPKGAVAIADLGNRFLTQAAFAALADGAQYRILQGKGVGVPFMKSPVLTKGKTSMSIAKHKPAAQQVTTIGYNGTTGALPTANNTSFFIKIRKRDNDAANRSQPMSLFAGPVKTDLTGTQEELARLLVRSGYKNFAEEPANNYLKFEAICSDAGAVPTGTTTIFTPVVGSKTVAINGTLTNVAVGDYIRLEGTGVTSAVYKVIAYTASTSIVLDSPFTGTAAAYAIANVRRITAALATAANFGIVITGKVAPFNVNSFRNYYANRFTATFSDSTTLVSPTTGAQNGNGVYQQVAMDEYMSYGFEGQNEQMAVPALRRDQEVKIPGVGTSTALTSKYSALSIAWDETNVGLVSTANGKGQVLVYLNLLNNAGTGTLSGGTSSGKELVTNLGLTASDLNE